MFIRLEVACNSDIHCRPTFVRIDDISQISVWDDENDSSVQSLVKLKNGEEFLCVTDILEFWRLLSDNDMVLMKKEDEE